MIARMAQAIDTKPQSVQQRSSASGVFRRLELDRLLRGASEAELRELVASGAVAELLDEDFVEDPLEF